jgi:hypothetical protein
MNLDEPFPHRSDISSQLEADHHPIEAVSHQIHRKDDNNMIAEQTLQESTIWSKLETEKKRQNGMRSRFLAHVGPSSSFEEGLPPAPLSPSSPPSPNGSASGQSRSINPSGIPHHPALPTDSSAPLSPNEPSAPHSTVRPATTLTPTPTSIPRSPAQTEKSRRKRKPLLSGWNAPRMGHPYGHPNYNNEHAKISHSKPPSKHHPHANPDLDPPGELMISRQELEQIDAKLSTTKLESSSQPRPMSSRSSVHSSATQETRPTSMTSTLTQSPSGPCSRSLSQSPYRSNNKQRVVSEAAASDEKPPLRRKLKNQVAPKLMVIPRVSSAESITSVEEGHSNDSSQPTEQSPHMSRSLSLGEHLAIQEPTSSSNAERDNSYRSNRTGVSSKSGPVYGSKRVMVKNVYKAECWVYIVAFFLFAFTSLGLSTLVLFVFGAYGPQISDQEQLQSRLEYLSEDPVVFDDPASPQSLALNWLAQEDESDIDLEDDVVRRESRYALAVLYYATEGETMWKDNLHFLSPRHECDWFSKEDLQGVSCDDDSKLVNVTIGKGWLC